uniref:receptor-transporting protein 3-like n=1 Tax=Centroberyx gerrardi TaxID=166262 RepID=UPI003AAF4962
MATHDWMRIFEAKVGKLNRRDNWRLQFDDSLSPDKPNMGWKMYKRSACARFSCSKCNRSWPSNRVMVVFHMRLSQSQGTVKVRRFRQNCKQCSEAPMEEATFGADNISILLEKLVEKIREKCYHQNLGKKNRPFRNMDVEGPHEAAHCEACIQGTCSMN